MLNDAIPLISRRRLLQKTSLGLGVAGVGSLLNPDARGDTDVPGILRRTHLRPRAKNVIHLFMRGGPSHVDTFDHKPTLRAQHGEQMPASVLGNQRVTLMTRGQGHFKVATTPYRFQRHGQAGHEISDIWRHLPGVADELCFIKSIHSEPINHDPAVTFMQTRRPLPGLPCMGSGVSYGLGSENRDLPAFIVMLSGPGDQPVPSRYYHSGFLPSSHQGVQFQASGDPVHYLSNPQGISTDDYGYNVADNPVHVNDLHATRLHLLGVDHQRLTFRFGGRDFRLTDVAGRVVPELIG